MKSASDGRVAGSAGSGRQLSSLCCRVISILDSFSKMSPWLCLQLIHSEVCFLFVHSIVGQLLLLATFELDF